MKNTKMKKGMFSALSVVILIIAVVAANVFISSKKITYDMTANQLYSLSDQTKSILKDLPGEVTIYVINDETKVNSTYAEIFDKYNKASKNIKFEYRSLSDYPNFAADYVDNVEAISNDSVVVSYKDKNRFIASDDFYAYDYNAYDYSIANATLQLENVLTQAIDYVVSDHVPVIYTLTGHSECDISYELKNKFQQDNYEVKELNLLTEGQVPEDCEILIINGAQKDLTEDEHKAVKSYMDQGGKAYIFLDALTEDLDHLYGLLKEYQVDVKKGIVVEADTNMFYQEAIYLLPEIKNSEVTAAQYKQNVFVLAPTSKGMTKIDSDDATYTVTSLLSTSSKSYSKLDTSSNDLKKAKEDIDGPFDIAVAVSDETGGRMIVVGSDNMTLTNVDTAVNGGNSDFILNGANYLSHQESKISIRAKSVISETIVVPEMMQKIILAVTVVGLPLLILIFGIVVVLKRRNL